MTPPPPPGRSALGHRLGRRGLLLGGSAALAGGFGLAGCSGNDSSSGTVPSMDSSKQVTITFMEAMASGSQQKALKKMVQDFQSAHSNITVKLAEQPDYGTLLTKITSQTAAGTPPTIAQVYGDWADELAESKVIVPLDQYVASSDQYDDFYDGIKADLKLTDDKTWMWPFNKSVVVQYYNTDMVKQAPKTWDDFATVAKKVSTGKVVALSMDPGSTSGPAGGTAVFEILAQANGDAVFAEDGTPQFTKPGVVTAMKYLIDLKKAGALALGKNYPGQAALGSETGAFDISSVASYPYNSKAVGDKFTMGVGQLPTGPAGAANQLAGTNIALFANASDQEKAAAWTFMQYLTEAKQQAYWASQTGYLPVTKKALDDPTFKAYAKKTPFVTGATKQLDSARSLPPKKWVNQASGALSVAIQSAVNGRAGAEDALAKAQQAGEQAQKNA